MMSNEALISTISQLQAEVETLGLRGPAAASAEQLQWLRHTRDSSVKWELNFWRQR